MAVNLYYADLLKSPIVITDDQTRGPTHPSSVTPDALNVGTLVTPLLFYGDGVADYGARVQQNLLNMLENFSSATAPATKVTGQLWHDSSINQLRLWNGATWDDVATTVNLTGKVNKSGDTLTGFLTLNADPVSALHAATKAYVDLVFIGSGVNILPSNNVFLGWNKFTGFGVGPGGGAVSLYAGADVTTTLAIETAALSGYVGFNGPTGKYAVGVRGTAFLTVGAGNTAWGVVTEAWTAPGIQGTLIGIEPAIIQQNNANSSTARGIDVVFKDRPDGAAATTSALGSNLFNAKAVAVAITSQTPSATAEYCGWTKGISFEAGSISRSVAQARAHLIDFYDATIDNASVNPLILTWKDRASAARHGLIYNTTNGFLELWRDIYGTPARAGYLSFESGTRDIDITNGFVSKAGGDNITTDLSFTFSTPGAFRPGMIWNNSTTQDVSSWNGVIKNLDGSIFSQTASQTIASSAAELTILGSGVGSPAFPTNFFTVGKNINVRLFGFFSTLNGSQTITVKIKLGSTVISTLVINPLPAATNNYFSIEFNMACRSTGVGGTFIGQGTVNFLSTYRMVMTAPVVVDTTLTQTLGVTLQWGGANAANTVTSTNGVINLVS